MADHPLLKSDLFCLLNNSDYDTKRIDAIGII
jgi:hypothetical protein